MSWQQTSIAISGTMLVVVLGSVLIWQIFRTVQLVLTMNGLMELEAGQWQEGAEREAAQRTGSARPAVFDENVTTSDRKQEKIG